MMSSVEKLVTTNFENFFIHFILKFAKKVKLWLRIKKRKKLNLQNFEPGSRVMCAQYCTHYKSKIDYLFTFDKINREFFINNPARICYNLGEQFTVLSIIDAPKETNPAIPNSKLITLINDQLNIQSFLFNEKVNYNLIEEIFELNTDKFNDILKMRDAHMQEARFPPFRIKTM